MPPLLGLAIAFGAEAIGATAIIAGTIASAAAALDIGAVTAGIIGDIGAGAIVGAAAGAGTAAAAGTDPGNGALWGAATGGATAGLTPGVEDVSGLSADTSQAIASGVVTTGAASAQGAPLGKALEYGAAAAAGSEAGNQIFGGGAGPGTTGSTPATSPAGAEQVTSTGQAAPTADISGALAPPAKQQANPSGASEQVTVDATAPPAPAPTVPVQQSNPAGAPEQVTVEASKNSGNASPSTLGTATKGLEKGALEAALFSFLFPQGSGQYAGGATGVTPATGAGGPSGAGSGGGVTSPAAVAALLGQSGQAGGTSGYAPGSPIFGEPGGANKYSPWNAESLRTAPGTA